LTTGVKQVTLYKEAGEICPAYYSQERQKEKKQNGN
tara:strand:- start:6 stop:113 length:108 start_codon:yes stop_codon:yes gene_type:complete